MKVLDVEKSLALVATASSKRSRNTLMQHLLGAPLDTSHPDTRAALHARALLVSRLSESKLWP